MRIKFKLDVYIAGLLLMSCAVTASARQWKIGAHADMLLGGRLERDRTFGVGAQLVHNFTDIYSAELAVSRYLAEHHDEDGRQLDITSTVLTGRVHFSPLTRFAAVYAGAGVGLYAVDDKGEEDDSLRIRPHVALGMEYWMTQSWELFADYRFTFTHIFYQDNFNHGLLRVGVNYCF